jgi:hypothetical protein
VVYTAVVDGATAGLTDVRFKLSFGLPLIQGVPALPVDTSNIGVVCRPLLQTEEVKATQVFACDQHGVLCSVKLPPHGAAHITVLVGGRGCDAVGGELHIEKKVPFAKIYLTASCLVKDLITRWGLQDSNGGGVSVEATVQVQQGFDLEQILSGPRPTNFPSLASNALMQGAEKRSDIISWMLYKAGGDNASRAALSMMASQMVVNAGVAGPPVNQKLLFVSEARLEEHLGNLRPPVEHLVVVQGSGHDADPAPPPGPNAAPPPGPNADPPLGPNAPPPGPAGETNPTQTGLFDPMQVTYIQTCLVQHRFHSYLCLAMPVVYGVAAKLADHLNMPRCSTAQQMQQLDVFLRTVDGDLEWSRAVHQLFKASLAEAWSSRTQYSMDPAVNVTVGPTGAHLILHGPGEVQDISGQKGISSRWLHAQKSGMDAAWNGVGMYDCEDGAGFFTAVECAVKHATELHLLGGARTHDIKQPRGTTKRLHRDMFDSMHEIMPSTDQKCTHTQRCAARLLLMIGADMLRSVGGVAYVAASAADAATAAATDATTGAKTQANAQTRSAVRTSWARLVGPQPTAGGHAVKMEAGVDDEVALGVRHKGKRTSVKVGKLQWTAPLESTALVMPAPVDEAPSIHGVTVQGVQQSQQVLQHGTGVSMAQCQSMCSAALAAEACKLLPTDTQASPVFVQAPGTTGFYIGAYCIGSRILVTEDAGSTGMAELQQAVRDNPDHLTVDQEQLLKISNSAKELPLPKLLTNLGRSKLSTWALYAEMGAGKKRVGEDGARRIWTLEPKLFESERKYCEQIAMHAAAEVPSVETLRQFKTPPLSSSEMRLHMLMPPGMTPHQAAQRTAQRYPCTGPVAPPTPFLQEGMVPMILKLRSPDTGMPSQDACINKGQAVLEMMGSEWGRNLTPECTLGLFPLQGV